MNDKVEDQLSELVNNVRDSSKYKDVAEDFIRSIGTQELVKRRKLKEAIKATKNKLHQVGGAFLDYKPNYSKWLNSLSQSVDSGNADELRRTCVEIMSHHTSTKERLTILDDFYATILADLPPINSVIDIACGLNPLSIPWMPLKENTQYYAYDIYEEMIDFLDKSIKILHMQSHARVCDAIEPHKYPAVDVAFILKAIPCLEQVDKSAGQRLIDSVSASHIFISFPVHSLCGKSKGMAMNYESRFNQLIVSKNWSVKRYEFSTELVFRISR